MIYVSVIIPMYNAEAYIKDAIQCVLNQTYSDYEILIINDGSTDSSLKICQQFSDPRIRIITQSNRGLAGARNTGIRNARGHYLAFLDADDRWQPEKLKHHVNHLSRDSKVGISYSQSYLMDDDGNPMGMTQKPKLIGITAIDILCRNPIGNGSAPVIRREVFNEISYTSRLYGTNEDFYFDELFRQSEDIECWTRIALTTDWKFEGIGLPLTWYRINAGGLSANLDAQYGNWNHAVEKARGYAPEFIGQWINRARAYQLRYLARRAIRSRNAEIATRMIHRAIRTDFRIMLEEPRRTAITLCCSWLLSILPSTIYQRIEMLFIEIASSLSRQSSNQT
ncbi:MAG: glycosyltransferase family 2 protein [Gammaproteobacteria bacterium]|nr:glycosyltransferase family 2 protein [Gammaproteobacteria bacterium]